MVKIFRILFDWSEVWALLIPVISIWIQKPKFKWIKPVALYLIIALILNVSIDSIWYANKYKIFVGNNNVFYNIHSLCRLLLFAWFFNYLGKPFTKLNRFIPALFLIVALIVYVFYDPILKINSKMLALESALLLAYCIIFYYLIIQDDQNPSSAISPPFWIVTGLSLFTAVNFFIYLFFNFLAVKNKDFSVSIWDVHNLFYIVMCIFFGIAFRKRWT